MNRADVFLTLLVMLLKVHYDKYLLRQHRRKQCIPASYIAAASEDAVVQQSFWSWSWSFIILNSSILWQTLLK